MKKNTAYENVRSIIEDHTGSIWIGDNHGLTNYYPALSARKKISENFTGYILEDSAGKIWLSMVEAGNNSMFLFLYDAMKLTKVNNKPHVFGIYQDRDGKIWFGTANGVMLYEPPYLPLTEGKFTAFTKNVKP